MFVKLANTIQGADFDAAHCGLRVPIHDRDRPRGRRGPEIDTSPTGPASRRTADAHHGAAATDLDSDEYLDLATVNESLPTSASS